MAQPLNLLIVEDNVLDAELVVRELVRAGFAPEWRRVDTEAEFLEHLHAGLDLVLSDYAMPQFNGLRALELLRASGLVIPFILVSGTIGEELAVNAMKQGATDYLLKDRLARLGSAVAQAMGDRGLRRERAAAALQLQESEGRFRAVLESIALIGVMLDRDGRITLGNDHLLNLTGWTREEALGADWFLHFLPPDSRTHIQHDIFQRSLATGELPKHYENEIVTRGGERRMIAWSNTLLHDPAGRINGLASIGEDITNRKRAEAALRVSDLALKAVSEGVIITGPDQVVISVNAAFVAITGYPTTEIIGRNCRFLQGPDTDPATVAAIRAALGGSGDFAGEVLNYRRDGTPFWNDLRIAAVRDETGRPAHFIGITRDITDRKLAEQRLARVSRLYVVLSRVNEMIVRTAEAAPLFSGVCRIAVEHGRFRLAAVMGLDAATGEVGPLAHFGAELGYFREMKVNIADPHLSQGTIGTAIRTGQCDICNDIAHDSRMEPWQRGLARRCFRSTASFPIRRGKGIFGALVLFSAETNIFQEEEIKLLAAVADGASFALEAIDRERQRQRAEAALRESEASMAAAQHIARLGSWELDLAGEEIDANTLRWSDELFRIAGLDPGVVRITNELFFSLVPPEEHEAIRRGVAAAIRTRGEYALVHRLIRPDGTTRFVHEMAQVKCDAQTGLPLKLVGTAHDITERKQAEVERDRLFNLSLDLLCVANFEGRLEQVNPAWTACLGWTAEELLARPMSELILPEDHEATARIRVRVQQGEPIRGFENRYRTKDGSHRWLSWSVHPLVESRQVFAVARDVTARKQTEEQLRASEERLRLVTDNARVGLMMVDRDRRYTFANTTYAEIFGVPAGEIVGRSVAEVLPQLYELRIRERLARAFTGERLTYELAWPPVGEPRHYLARYEPTVVDGAVAVVVVVITDITERKHAEEALRAGVGVQLELAEQLERERARLIMAQEVANVGSWETDLATLAVVWSAETFRIFEKNREKFQPTHAHFLQRVHPEDRAAVDLAFTRSLKRTGPFKIEHRLLFPDGRIKFVEERWVVVAGGQGRPGRAVGTCQDITPRREAEDAIRAAAAQMRALALRLQSVREEERTTLAREIHDVLAQELTRLKIDLVWLAKRAGRPADEASHAAINRRIADALAQTDTAITTVQRIATELRPVILDSLGLPAALEWQAEDFARRTGIVCRARAARSETALSREQATAIFRILQESLTNVARHAEASEVEVEFTEHAGMATLTVRDNGVGISRAQMENPRSIGLLGMRERTLAFGGVVEISGEPGAGTTVIVRLPLASPR